MGVNMRTPLPGCFPSGFPSNRNRLDERGAFGLGGEWWEVSVAVISAISMSGDSMRSRLRLSLGVLVGPL